MVTETIWMGDIARSGVMDPEDSGVMAREYVVMVRGDMALSGVQNPSGGDEDPLALNDGEMDEF